jgi:hydroxyethylthiazole kinase
VGAGATKLRTEMTRKIIREAEVSVIRGNASEILSLFSDEVKTRGVDSSLSVNDSIIDAAQKIALETQCIIAISGRNDIITDGKRIFSVSNGQPIMTRVTGIGCGLTAVVGAFCAEAEGEFLLAVTAAHAFYGLCGELAHESGQGPGTFFIRFLDLLSSAGEKQIRDCLKVNQI